jgi:HlyD family secretion protein
MHQPRRDLSRAVSILWQCLRNAAVLSLIGLCAACGSLQARNNTSDTPSPTEPAPSTRVVALGKLVPEGDVIKISVVNAKDSRVNQILVKEGDKVKTNRVIAILQGQDTASQQLRDAEANVAIRRAQLLKIRQGGRCQTGRACCSTFYHR